MTLTTDTLAAYERGLRREIEAVRAAQQLTASATDPEQRSQAMQAQWETATIPQGAQASGLDEARYRDVREAVADLPAIRAACERAGYVVKVQPEAIAV